MCLRIFRPIAQEGDQTMQCYESKLMRLSLYRLIISHNPGLRYDDGVLSDLLDDYGIESLEEIVAMKPEMLKTIVGQFGQNMPLAA
jgi:hypothetical protein